MKPRAVVFALQEVPGKAALLARLASSWSASRKAGVSHVRAESVAGAEPSCLLQAAAWAPVQNPSHLMPECMLSVRPEWETVHEVS